MHAALVNLVGILISVLLVALIYFKWSFGYWKRRNVPYVEPTIPFGNLGSPIRRKQGFYKDLQDAYRELKSRGCKHGGFFSATLPIYVPIDPEIVKNVMVKDFQHFVNHGGYFNEKDDPLSAHLFAIEDDKWRKMRAKLSPTFTSGKMKMMLQTLKDCSVPLLEEIDRLDGKKEVLDIKELVARFTTDIIGSCAFGIDCNSFKDPDAEFRKFGKKAFIIDFTIQMKFFLVLSFPKIAQMIRLTLTQSDVSKFFLDMVKNTVEQREANNTKRADFMQLMIDMKNSADPLTLNEISAQAFLFFVAGFETSSTTMSFCFYELALNQAVQDRAREEIDAVLERHGGEVTYEAIQEMKYLGQVIDETLRMYPPLPLLNRVCNKTYQVPGTDVVLEKDTQVWIPNYAIQHDPDLFPEPETFNPDRFDEANKDNIVPYTFLSFGEGPRICIGSRFGIMQMKIGLVTILKNFRLTLNERTPKKISINPNSFLLTNLETIYLNSERIKKSN